MLENASIDENDLVGEAIDWLRKAVPETWSVTESASQTLQVAAQGQVAADIRAESGDGTTLIIEAKRTFSPRTIENLFSSRLASVYLSRNSSSPLLVVAEWLSPRTRQLLEEKEVNYLDLTGNALIRLSQPALFIRSTGLSKSPLVARKPEARLRGPKAARVIRLLLDVRPPYGIRDLATASGIAASYVSRLINAFDRDALVERSKQGGVKDVDIANLLRRWAEAYDVFKSNEAQTFLIPKGPKEVLRRLPALPRLGRTAITGSFAAARLAPVAGPTLLMVYSKKPDALVKEFGLLPTDQGSNVVLLTPYDPVVWAQGGERGGYWDRDDVANPVPYVSPSQVAIDCLTGNGRMPQEGEAVVEWMVDNQDVWRATSLEQFRWE